MSKDETPPSGGLLSKVVRFVRNPTVNWNALDSIQTERESQYSKQVLKDMLERKRRNDFIRRREFDQLRKLRQRDAMGSSRGEADPDQAARPSQFHSTITSPDERAVTIRKIDEIEAQMSKTWWKGPGASTGVPPGAPSGPLGNAENPASPHAFAPTEPLSLPMAMALRRAQRQDTSYNAPSATSMQPLEPAFALPQSAACPQELVQSPVPKAELALPFVHNPDLEEAAIRFANGDSAGAEASLLEVLTQRTSDPAPQQFEVWMTLFDLYRATGQQDRFDSAGLEFAARFHRSGPLWFSLPEQLGWAAQEPEAAPQARQSERVWNCPSQLTAQTVAALQLWLERNQAPWTMVWSRLVSMDENALPALTEVFLHWAEQPVHLVFADAEVLHALLQAHTVSDERSSDPQWWRLRMAALRFMNQPDAFEMVALDYCVTYEVSPPSWQIPECTYRDGAAHHEEGTSVADAEGGSADVSVQKYKLQGVKQWSDSITESMLSGSLAGTQTQQVLQGHVEGDAGELLDALADNGNGAASAVALHIDCGRLIRVDFAAAGSVLNWAARQQAMGRSIHFERMNRMVAVFFNVIGISEYAVVQPRKADGVCLRCKPVELKAAVGRFFAA